jgi:hypothetical protein
MSKTYPTNKIPLIGEEYIDDGVAFAERMIAEAESVWASPGWKQESERGGILVESQSVSGVFESAGIRVMRSRGPVGAPHDKVFKFLVSPAGFAMLDPVSNGEDHHNPPIQTYPWRENSRLEAAVASAKIPFLPPAEFVVLNAIDFSTCIFVSKSILHNNKPGGSIYSGIPPVPGAKTRAINTFAAKTVPLDLDRCELFCINFVDMGIKGPAFIYNLINRRFFAPLYKRLNKRLINPG